MTEETKIDFSFLVEDNREDSIDFSKIDKLPKPEKKEISIDEYFDMLAEQEDERVLLFSNSF